MLAALGLPYLASKAAGTLNKSPWFLKTKARIILLPFGERIHIGERIHKCRAATLRANSEVASRSPRAAARDSQPSTARRPCACAADLHEPRPARARSRSARAEYRGWSRRVRCIRCRYARLRRGARAPDRPR